MIKIHSVSHNYGECIVYNKSLKGKHDSLAACVSCNNNLVHFNIPSLVATDM